MAALTTAPTNLTECQTPLFRFLQRLAETGKSTATQMYDAPGWVAHTVTNAWGYSAPGTAMGWGLNVTGGAWLATHLWEHYEYGGDVTFLREVAYPVLRDAALFLLGYLTADPATGHLVAGPSESPENWYAAPGRTCAHCSCVNEARLRAHEHPHRGFHPEPRADPEHPCRCDAMGHAASSQRLEDS